LPRPQCDDLADRADRRAAQDIAILGSGDDRLMVKPQCGQRHHFRPARFVPPPSLFLSASHARTAPHEGRQSQTRFPQRTGHTAEFWRLYAEQVRRGGHLSHGFRRSNPGYCTMSGA